MELVTEQMVLNAENHYRMLTIKINEAKKNYQHHLDVLNDVKTMSLSLKVYLGFKLETKQARVIACNAINEARQDRHKYHKVMREIKSNYRRQLLVQETEEYNKIKDSLKSLLDDKQLKVLKQMIINKEI